MAVLAKHIAPAKAAAIEDTKNFLAAYDDFIFVEYRGLTVEQITNLRHSLREKNTAFRVVKNDFARIAFDELEDTSGGSTRASQVAAYLTGPTAIAPVKGDGANESAKVLFDFAKDAPALVVKGAWISGELYDAKKIEEYSKLPGKMQLIAMIMSAINGPARTLAATLQAYVESKTGGAPAEAGA